MSISRSVADVLRDHVALEVEGIDRMYLNVYQPRLQVDKMAAAYILQGALDRLRNLRGA